MDHGLTALPVQTHRFYLYARALARCNLSTPQAKDRQRSEDGGEEGGGSVVKSRCDLEHACVMKEKQ